MIKTIRPKWKMSDADGFTVVSSNRNRHKGKFKSKNIPKGARDSGNIEDDVSSEEIVSKVMKLKSEILNDQYVNIVTDGISQIKKHLAEQHDVKSNKIDLISYGVGNFASCLIARYQLALLLVMRDELDGSLAKCEVYDPIFTEGEKESLQKLSLAVIQVNEEGKRKVDSPSVFYMPHCGKALYNNLLWANWSPSRLKNLVIIGNSFGQMLESIPSSIMKKEASYIYQIQQYTEELPMENKFRFDDIFNNTSIHSFKKDSMDNADNSVWTIKEEPVYDNDNVEIIVRTM